MGRVRTALRILSFALILLGTGLLTVILGLYAQASHEQAVVASTFKAPESDPVTLPQAPGVDPSGPPSALQSDAPALPSAPDIPQPLPNDDENPVVHQLSEAVTPSASPTPVSPTPTPTKTRQFGPARWIRIPTINVDSPVVEAKIKNGEWEVPKFVAGHLEGTSDPGPSGNVALTGHVESLTGGNVFARIGELHDGDNIFLYSEIALLPYQVSQTLVVKNDDLDVLSPTPGPVLTLITCTGTWNPFTRDYSERLIVRATPVEFATLLK